MYTVSVPHRPKGRSKEDKEGRRGGGGGGEEGGGYKVVEEGGWKLIFL